MVFQVHVEEGIRLMYTTYFANVKKLDTYRNLVSIARKTPPGFPGRIFLQLAPPEELLWRTKNSGDYNSYIEEYYEMLYELDVHKIAKELGPDAVLVCYEGKDKFCHRHLVAMWLSDAGYSVVEI